MIYGYTWRHIGRISGPHLFLIGFQLHFQRICFFQILKLKKHTRIKREKP